jgi:hypothetical protein
MWLIVFDSNRKIMSGFETNMGACRAFSIMSGFSSGGKQTSDIEVRNLVVDDERIFEAAYPFPDLIAPQLQLSEARVGGEGVGYESASVCKGLGVSVSEFTALW